MTETADSRTRVLAALEHRESDRVPIDFWSTPEVDARLMEYLSAADRDAMLDNFDVDLRYLDGPRYVGPELAVRADGRQEDLWGGLCTAAAASDGSGDDPEDGARPPLADAGTPADVAAYKEWPSPDWFDYSVVADEAERIREAGRVAVFRGDPLNRIAQWQPAQRLRGTEQLVVDMAIEPAIWWAVAERVTEFYIEYLRHVFEAADDRIDILFMSDDFAASKGMVLPPAIWRQYLKPGFKKLVEAAKEHGCRVAHRTDGGVWPIVKDMVECGLDILSPIQPWAAGMDLRQLKEQFGRDLVFHGSIDALRTLRSGTPKQIRAEVKDRMDVLAPGGGFIFCTGHEIQPDAPTENVLALIDAYRTLGRYKH